MKKIYLVRHGETNANAMAYVPGKAEPLNERGIEQASVLAERVSHITVEALVTSDFMRARQTMEPIEAVFKQAAKVTPLFGEVFEPTSLHSLPEDSELVHEHRKSRNSHVEDTSWRMEDGENMSDVFERVARILFVLVWRCDIA
jgi:broad specificity phosphatase PhoE